MNAWLKRCVFNLDLNRESFATLGSGLDCSVIED